MSQNVAGYQHLASRLNQETVIKPRGELHSGDLLEGGLRNVCPAHRHLRAFPAPCTCRHSGCTPPLVHNACRLRGWRQGCNVGGQHQLQHGLLVNKRDRVSTAGQVRVAPHRLRPSRKALTRLQHLVSATCIALGYIVAENDGRVQHQEAQVEQHTAISCKQLEGAQTRTFTNSGTVSITNCAVCTRGCVLPGPTGTGSAGGIGLDTSSEHCMTTSCTQLRCLLRCLWPAGWLSSEAACTP